MVISHRTIKYVSDKTKQAREWTTRLAKYMRQKYPKYNVRLLRSVVGDMSTLHWLTEHESLADLERFQKEFEADKGYQDFLAEDANKGWRIDGSAHLEAYETIVG